MPDERPEMHARNSDEPLLRDPNAPMINRMDQVSRWMISAVGLLHWALVNLQLDSSKRAALGDQSA